MPSSNQSHDTPLYCINQVIGTDPRLYTSQPPLVHLSALLIKEAGEDWSQQWFRGNLKEAGIRSEATLSWEPAKKDEGSSLIYLLLPNIRSCYPP